MAKYVKSVYITKDSDGKTHYSSALPTDYDVSTSPYQITSKVGDRWDLIAYRFLGNAKYWYAVANANGGANGSIFIKPGTTITIPEVI